MRIAINLCMKDFYHRRLYVALLWLVVVFSAVVDVLLPRYAQLFSLHSYIALPIIVLCFLITALAVQSDPLMGDRRFWITRPISWQNLLAGKILFLICTIHAPVLIAQSAAMIANGFSPLQHLPALAKAQLSLAVILTVAAVFASVTRNLVHMGIVFLAAGFAVMIAQTQWNNYLFDDWDSARNLRFWIDSIPLVLIGAFLLWLQYRTRKARYVIALTFILLIAGFSQYNEVNEKLWHAAARYRAWQDGVLRNQSPVAATFISGSPAIYSNGEKIVGDFAFRVQFTGIPKEHNLFLEKANFAITAPDGSAWESGWKWCASGHFIISAGDECQIIASINKGFYQHVRNQAVHVRALLALRLFGPPKQVMPQQGKLSPAVYRAGLCGLPWDQIEQPICIFTDFPSALFFYRDYKDSNDYPISFDYSEFSGSIWRCRTAQMGGFSNPPQWISMRREEAWFETTMDIPQIRLSD
jgi:hypothetical protein